MTDQKMREAFEKAYWQHMLEFVAHSTGSDKYQHESAEKFWQFWQTAWQAALASAQPEGPELTDDDLDEMYTLTPDRFAFARRVIAADRARRGGVEPEPRQSIKKIAVQAAVEAAQADADPNAPWLTVAHGICTNAGVAQGHISDRLAILSDSLAATGFKVKTRCAAPPAVPAELLEAEYQRGFKAGYNQRDDEVRGALV